jgi:HNH endonuclease
MQIVTSELPREVRLFVWKRDEFRCRECGVGVGRRGCKPQTHHIVPRANGGSDDPENLITLCFPCHATKVGHLQMLGQAPPELLTDFVKYWTWDLATNLLGWAEAMDPRKFPVQAIRENLLVWRRYLDLILAHADQVIEDRSAHVVSGEFEIDDGPVRPVDRVLLGVERSWFADLVSKYLDGEIVEAKRQWRTQLRDE